MKKKNPTENSTQLGNLLLRYKSHFKPPQASVEKECVEVIKQVTGINLTPQQLSYTVGTKTLVLKTPSLIRSELKTQYPVILQELKGRLGEGNAPTTII